MTLSRSGGREAGVGCAPPPAHASVAAIAYSSSTSAWRKDSTHKPVGERRGRSEAASLAAPTVAFVMARRGRFAACRCTRRCTSACAACRFVDARAVAALGRSVPHPPLAMALRNLAFKLLSLPAWLIRVHQGPLCDNLHTNSFREAHLLSVCVCSNS